MSVGQRNMKVRYRIILSTLIFLFVKIKNQPIINIWTTVEDMEAMLAAHP